MDRFREHFAGFENHYVLIGGAACDLAMEEAGLAFRATKDLDIVLCVEVLDAAFVKAFWEFVKKGVYRNQQQSTGKKLFYRFHDPEDEAFPWMLELFSRCLIPWPWKVSRTSRPSPLGRNSRACPPS